MGMENIFSIFIFKRISENIKKETTFRNGPKLIE